MATGIGRSDPPEGEGNLALLTLAGSNMNQRGCLRDRRLGLVLIRDGGSLRQFAEQLGGKLHHLVMIDGPRCGENRFPRMVMPLQVIQQIVARDGGKGLPGAGDGVGQGMPFPSLLVQKFMDILSGFIPHHLDFLGNDAAFPLDFGGLKQRISVHVRKDGCHAGEMIGGCGGVVTGSFLSRKRIKIAADPFDLFADLSRRALLRPLKQEMLQKM